MPPLRPLSARACLAPVLAPALAPVLAAALACALAPSAAQASEYAGPVAPGAETFELAASLVPLAPAAPAVTPAPLTPALVPGFVPTLTPAALTSLIPAALAPAGSLGAAPDPAAAVTPAAAPGAEPAPAVEAAPAPRWHRDPIEGFAAYDPASTCSPTPKVGTERLATFVVAHFGGAFGGISRACPVPVAVEVPAEDLPIPTPAPAPKPAPAPAPSFGHQSASHQPAAQPSPAPAPKPEPVIEWHTPPVDSEHMEGRAFDWTLDATRKADRRAARAFLRWALATSASGQADAKARRLGIMYIIWDDVIYSADHRFAPRPYVHPDCASAAACSATLQHRDHVHISLTRAAAEGGTSWFEGRR